MITITDTKDYSLLAGMNEEVQLLHHQLYPEVFKPYDKDAVSGFFRQIIEKDNVKAFIAVENQQVLGYVLLFVNQLDENPFQYERRFVQLDQILVSKSSRTKGVGKMLVEKTFSFARSLGIGHIELNHWTLNETARHFFRQNGFEYFNEKMSIRL